MGGYGHAFKIVRQIKQIPIKDAATNLGIDERSLRDIENGKTTLVTERFGQLLDFYKIDHNLIFELAEDKVSLQNVVHEAKRDGIVVNQNKNLEALLEARIVNLENQLKMMHEQQVVFLDLINQMLKNSKG